MAAQTKDTRVETRAEHAPLPWRVSEFGTLLLDANNQSERDWTHEMRVASRRFVAECVNRHHALVQERDALLLALKGLRERCNYSDLREWADDVIAKAEGTTHAD